MNGHVLVSPGFYPHFGMALDTGSDTDGVRRWNSMLVCDDGKSVTQAADQVLREWGYRRVGGWKTYPDGTMTATAGILSPPESP